MEIVCLLALQREISLRQVLCLLKLYDWENATSARPLLVLPGPLVEGMALKTRGQRTESTTGAERNAEGECEREGKDGVRVGRERINRGVQLILAHDG